MKKTTKKISAAALALVMGATAFTGCWEVRIPHPAERTAPHQQQAAEQLPAVRRKCLLTKM